MLPKRLDGGLTNHHLFCLGGGGASKCNKTDRNRLAIWLLVFCSFSARRMHHLLGDKWGQWAAASTAGLAAGLGGGGRQAGGAGDPDTSQAPPLTAGGTDGPAARPQDQGPRGAPTGTRGRAQRRPVRRGARVRGGERRLQCRGKAGRGRCARRSSVGFPASSSRAGRETRGLVPPDGATLFPVEAPFGPDPSRLPAALLHAL